MDAVLRHLRFEPATVATVFGILAILIVLPRVVAVVSYLLPGASLKKYGSWAVVTGGTDGIGLAYGAYVKVHLPNNRLVFISNKCLFFSKATFEGRIGCNHHFTHSKQTGGHCCRALCKVSSPTGLLTVRFVRWPLDASTPPFF